MKEKSISENSSTTVENTLIKAVLSGEYPPGSTLPSERELSATLGVARPTLREALQRLARDKWFTKRKGHATIVNDFWKLGNLNTLENIITNTDQPNGQFIVHLLEVRAALAPEFVHKAVLSNPAKVVAVLANSSELEDDCEQFTLFDWKLQTKLAELAQNPIYLLIMNSFTEIYNLMGRLYFSHQENREVTREFYLKLLAMAMAEDADKAEQLTKEEMIKSIDLWKKSQSI
ncbi:fatty acid metabolism transcriptional regulator FadR [Bacillus sp. SM2101]|uniref:fatty acid metabolism transcriptional regulator FadR n=1 Tax=Bacillus sp. SM2101 TaxID=2805366 RepID=UPI001BDE41AB|nr:fatty acid metabolism transcriptional regulator FadR [Bacillus sp. SM2101]